MAWTGAHCAFAVETFKTGESVIATQRAFCAHFILCQNDPVLDSLLGLVGFMAYQPL